MAYYLRSLLLAEGARDEVLCPILSWLLEECVQQSVVETTVFASKIRKLDIANRMEATFKIYPKADFDIFFVHLDADARSGQPKREIIMQAYASRHSQLPDTIAVISVQETEAWLMFNEPAIRSAANNSKGTIPLKMPSLKNMETIARPKEKLQSILTEANKQNGKGELDFDLHDAMQRLVQQFLDQEITDFSPLRSLAAFRVLEEDIKALVQQHHW